MSRSRRAAAHACAVAGVGLVAAGLWLWGESPTLAQRATRVQSADYALKSAAVALVAAAQVCFAAGVVSAYFRAGRVERFFAAAGFLAALIAAAAAAWLGAQAW